MIRPRYKVFRAAFTGTVQDDYGNTTEAWADPEEEKVFGISFPQSEEFWGEGPNRIVIESVLLVPRDYPAQEKDRFYLPRYPGKTYEAVGIVEDAEGNPFGWNPGGRIKLRRVHG